MVPVPPAARMFEGCAAVIWHFGDVGPVPTDDVLEELHATTHNASIATIGTSAGEYLRGINVLSSTTRAVGLWAYDAPVIWRGIALYVVALAVRGRPGRLLPLARSSPARFKPPSGALRRDNRCDGYVVLLDELEPGEV